MAKLGVVEGYGVSVSVTAPKRSVVLALQVERLGGEAAVARIGSFRSVEEAWQAAQKACASAFGEKAELVERPWEGTPEWALSAPYFVVDEVGGDRGVAVTRRLLRALESGRDPAIEIARRPPAQVVEAEGEGVRSAISQGRYKVEGPGKSVRIRSRGMVEISSERVLGLWKREGFGEAETLVAHFRGGPSRLAKALAAGI